jgi:hypothetical protein
MAPMRSREIGPAHQVVEVHARDVQRVLLGSGERTRRRVADLHVEGAGATREGAADRTEADDPEPPAVGVLRGQRQVPVGLPAAIAHDPIVLDDAVLQRQEQRHRVVGDRLGIGADRPGEGDVAAGQRVAIDAVHADAEVDDAAQRRHAVEQLVVDALAERPDPPRPRQVLGGRRREHRPVEEPHVAALEHLVHQPASQAVAHEQQRLSAHRSRCR